MHGFRLAIILGACLASFESPVAGQTPDRDVETKCTAVEVVETATALVYGKEPLPSDSDAAIAQAVYRTPPTAAKVTENQAATTNGTSPNAVEGAGRTNLLALALDSGIVNSDGGAVSFSAAPLFDFVALRDPRVRDDESLYRDYGWARRLGIKITAGGKGDAFDRDGDGVVDDALTATAPSDIITYEVSLQFGSRDRREETNYRTIRRDVVEPNRAEREKARTDASHRVPYEGTATQLSCVEAARAMLYDPVFLSDIDALHRADLAVERRAAKVAEEIDAKPILRLVVQRTERKRQFGGDKRAIGLRFSKGFANAETGGANLDIQLDYLRNELPYGGDELEGWKLGTKYTRALLRDSEWFGGKGLLFSASGSVEKYSDVPPGTKDSLARLDLAWTFKVGDKAMLPLSITWANRTDLLKDHKDVIAHVGYSFDMDAFFQAMPH